jgi:hypothetical protein
MNRNSDRENKIRIYLVLKSTTLFSMDIVPGPSIHGSGNSSQKTLNERFESQSTGRTVSKVNNGMLESPSPRQVE